VIGGGGSRYGGAQCSSPAGGDHHHTSFCSNHELDEIAVVSTNADPLHVKYGSGTLTAANGPRLVPGRFVSTNKLMTYIIMYLVLFFSGVQDTMFMEISCTLIFMQ
jgi:hypothetical protein